MNKHTLAFLYSKPVKPTPVLVIKANAVLIKIADAKEYERVSTLKQFDDGSFQVLRESGWQTYSNTKIQVVY